MGFKRTRILEAGRFEDIGMDDDREESKQKAPL